MNAQWTVAAGLVLAIPLALATPGRAMDDPGYPLRVLSFNIEGAARQRGDHNSDKDPYRFVRFLADRIAAERPHLVALQEVCGSQLRYLEGLLAQRGYYMQPHFVPDPVNKNDGRCPAHPEAPFPPRAVSTAVLTVGASDPAPALPSGPHVNTCAYWKGSPIPIRICSVHTDPNFLPGMSQHLGEWAVEGPVIAAGDFNTAPNEAPINLMYHDSFGFGRFYEADWADSHCTHVPGGTAKRCGEPTAPTFPVAVRKIDYIFASAGDFVQKDMSARVESTAGKCAGKPCSDHRMLWGELNWDATSECSERQKRLAEGLAASRPKVGTAIAVCDGPFLVVKLVPHIRPPLAYPLFEIYRLRSKQPGFDFVWGAGNGLPVPHSCDSLPAYVRRFPAVIASVGCGQLAISGNQVAAGGLGVRRPSLRGAPSSSEAAEAIQGF